MALVESRDRKKIRTRIEERGRTAMFVGYAGDHTGDVTDSYTPKPDKSF